MKKILIICSLALIAASCGKSLTNQQADPYASWLTYQNSRFGYSVKYPSNLSAEDSDKINNDTSLSVVKFLDPTQGGGDRPYVGDEVTINVNSRYVITSPEQRINELIAADEKLYESTGAKGDNSTSTVLIAGQQAIEEQYKPFTPTGSSKQNKGLIVVHFYYNRAMYSIAANYNPELVNGFIQTFKLSK